MGSRLDYIKDWEAVARTARYRVDLMARLLKVSRHTLRSHLVQIRGCNPRQWIFELRLARAGALLTQGIACKEIAFELGLTPSSLSRFFQRAAGSSARHPHLSRLQIDAPSPEILEPFDEDSSDEPIASQSFVIWQERTVASKRISATSQNDKKLPKTTSVGNGYQPLPSI